MADRIELYKGLSEEEVAALVYEDFPLFAQTMYRATRTAEPLVWGPYLDLMCAMLGDVVHGRRRRLIITLPPRSLKSFCVSVCMPAFLLGHYPDQEVMCISYGHELANQLASDCMSLMRSPAYIEVFGPRLGPQRQPVHRFQTLNGGKRRATSLDGVSTGVGGDALIIDDPQKAGETLSDAIRRASNAQYENAFVSRGNLPSRTRIVIVMQRLHEDDFVGHVLSLGDTWEVLNLPAIAEEDQCIPYATALGRRTYRRREGEALHPARVSLAELEIIRRTVGEAVFASQYQQRPAPAGGGIVKTAWFKRYKPENKPPAFDRIVQSWDTAFTSGVSSDYSCCTTWGVKDKHAYLLSVYRDRIEFQALHKMVIQLAAIHAATTVLIEEKGSGISLLQVLRDANFGKARGVKVTVDKQTRMQDQTVMIENGMVHIPDEAIWLEEYLHELSVFPKGRYDDQVDSTSQALDNLFKWTEGLGFFEHIRQEAADLAAEVARVYRMRSLDQCNQLIKMDGQIVRPDADGVFLVPHSDAQWLRAHMRWIVLD